MDFNDDGPQVLLTEGSNDCHVILALCKLHQIPKSFGFYNCKSDKNVLRKLRAMLAGAKTYNTIGVLLDADNPSLRGKWDALAHILSAEGYTLPPSPVPSGTIVTQQNKPNIGIWLMPDNNVDGMIEHFCNQLFSSNVRGYVEDCVDKAKQDGLTSFVDAHQAKAIIHTYLAWQDTPGMPIGQAITARTLNGSSPLALSFVAFLNRLFVGQTET